jgi:prolyl-tRNA synthetase
VSLEHDRRGRRRHAVGDPARHAAAALDRARRTACASASRTTASGADGREGGFVYAGWCGDGACEAEIKEETKATIRCLPDEEFRSAEAPTTCLKCGRASTVEALWAKAY